MSRPAGYENSLLSHECLGSYLKAYMDLRKKSDRFYSYRKLAADLSIKSTTMLSMVVNGRRVPSETFMVKMADFFTWSDVEKRFANALLILTTGTKGQKSAAKKLIKEIRLGAQSANFGYEQFSQSKWYDIVILEMLDLADFDDDPAAIAARLGKVTAAEAEAAVSRLQALGFVERNRRGRLTRVVEPLVTPGTVPSRDIRAYHKTMLELATDALETQAMGKRLFWGTTLTINTASVPRVQKLFEEFAAKLIAHTHARGGDETFQFGMQFFKLTAAKRQRHTI